MPRMRKTLLLPIILLAACSSEDKTAGGTTASEARALEDAAEMLQDQRLPAGSIPSGQVGMPSSPAPQQAPPTKPAG